MSFPFLIGLPATSPTCSSYCNTYLSDQARKSPNLQYFIPLHLGFNAHQQNDINPTGEQRTIHILIRHVLHPQTHVPLHCYYGPTIDLVLHANDVKPPSDRSSWTLIFWVLFPISLRTNSSCPVANSLAWTSAPLIGRLTAKF